VFMAAGERINRSRDILRIYGFEFFGTLLE
jgi:hypothetical protein